MSSNKEVMNFYFLQIRIVFNWILCVDDTCILNPINIRIKTT